MSIQGIAALAVVLIWLAAPILIFVRCAAAFAPGPQITAPAIDPRIDCDLFQTFMTSAPTASIVLVATARRWEQRPLTSTAELYACVDIPRARTTVDATTPHALPSRA